MDIKAFQNYPGSIATVLPMIFQLSPPKLKVTTTKNHVPLTNFRAEYMNYIVFFGKQNESFTETMYCLIGNISPKASIIRISPDFLIKRSGFSQSILGQRLKSFLGEPQ